MRVYLDDKKSPENHLSEKDREGLFVFKDPLATLRFLHENEKDIEVAYLGHYPTDYYFQGSDIVEDIFLHKYYNDGKYFPKLSKIYLHNIDSGFKNTLISKHQKELKKLGIELTTLD